MKKVNSYRKIGKGTLIKIPVEKLKIPKSTYFTEVNKKYLREVKDSIEKDGIIHPILIDGNYYIKDGRYRFLAMKELGFLEIPCVVVIRRNYYDFYRGK